MERNYEKGITLIALIITIIVILILAGVTISSFRNGGTVQRAKEQTFKAALSSVKEDYEVFKIGFEDNQGLNINDFPVQDYIRGYHSYESNLQDAVSLIKTAEGALYEVHSILQRMEELLKQSANDTNTQEDRNSIHDELVHLTQEIDRISNITNFNEIQLLNSNKVEKVFYDSDYYFEIQLNDISSNALNIRIENNSASASEMSLQTVQSAINEISKIRSNLGKTQNNLEDKIDDLAKRATLLQKYEYLDEIKLKRVSGEGKDESATIQKIDEILGNIVGIGTLNVDILRSEVVSLKQAIQNAEDIVELVQTAEGTLCEIFDALQRMNELATKASNETNLEDKQMMQNEINSLVQEINRISSETKYNGQKLLDGSYNKAHVIGMDGSTIQISIDNCSTNNIGENGNAIYTNILTAEDASKTIDSIKTAIYNISNTRAKLGAKQNGLEHTINNLENIQENIQAGIDYISSNEQCGTENFGGAIRTVQVAEGALNEIHSILQRINELVVKGLNYTMEESDRESILIEINDLIAEIDRIANGTSYAGRKLLNGTYNENHTIGIYGETLTIQINNCSTNTILQMNLDISKPESFLQAEEIVTNAINIIGLERGKLGAIQNRLEHSANYHNLIKRVLNLKLENQTKKDLRLSLAGLEEIQCILSRLNELTIKASTATYSFSGIRAINYEIEQLLQEIDRIANYTKSNEIILLNGEYDKNNNVTVNALGLAGLNLESISSPEMASEQVKKIKTAIGKVFSLRKELAIKEGSYQKRDGEFVVEGDMMNKIRVSEGKLVYIGKDRNEQKWAQDLGIEVGN